MIFRIIEAAQPGKCDWCPRTYETGDIIGILPDDTIACAASMREISDLERAA
ncbi:hypothetical protein [Streptomyces sp. NPDC017448]|uniref:hypothetical protein n=1 Tax=Streptomyces sp. NPDC017448 TaxID=3364996 RepID=UPI0037946179